MKPEEKAIALSYILSELLADNLDIAVHEMKVSKHPNAGQMLDKFTKLRSANRNAFRILEKNVGDVTQMKNDIQVILESIWD